MQTISRDAAGISQVYSRQDFTGLKFVTRGVEYAPPACGGRARGVARMRPRSAADTRITDGGYTKEFHVYISQATWRRRTETFTPRGRCTGSRKGATPSRLKKIGMSSPWALNLFFIWTPLTEISSILILSMPSDR